MKSCIKFLFLFYQLHLFKMHHIWLSTHEFSFFWDVIITLKINKCLLFCNFIAGLCHVLIPYTVLRELDGLKKSVSFHLSSNQIEMKYEIWLSNIADVFYAIFFLMKRKLSTALDNLISSSSTFHYLDYKNTISY